MSEAAWKDDEVRGGLPDVPLIVEGLLVEIEELRASGRDLARFLIFVAKGGRFQNR